MDTIPGSGQPAVLQPCVRLSLARGAVAHAEPSRRPPPLDTGRLGSPTRVGAAAAEPPAGSAGTQAVVHMLCRRLHVRLLGRYAYDLMHILSDQCGAGGVGGAAAGGGGGHVPSPLGRSPAVPLLAGQRYSALLTAVLRDCWVDVPRHSWSDELFRLAIGHAHVMWPASPRYLAALQERASRCVRRYACACTQMRGREGVERRL